MAKPKYNTLPIGAKFNRWTVLSAAHQIPTDAAHKFRWLCRCECGTERIVIGRSLVDGKSKSCGCYERDNPSRLRHGHGKPGHQTPEYIAWANMIQRGSNTNRPQAHDYVNRGITVCARWSSFDSFLQDMGLRPGKGYSIDRRDNNGIYEPDNCYWATRLEQGRNQRSNYWIEWKGERLTASDWARRLQCNRRTLTGRIEKGWSIERAMTTPFSNTSAKT